MNTIRVRARGMVRARYRLKVRVRTRGMVMARYRFKVRVRARGMVRASYMFKGRVRARNKYSSPGNREGFKEPRNTRIELLLRD